MKHLLYFTITSIMICASLQNGYAQDQREYRKNEVIELTNGMKIEILKWRGDGPSREVDVIYYTDKRQLGKRMWQLATVLFREENAALIARGMKPLFKTTEPTKVPDEKIVKTIITTPEVKIPEPPTAAVVPLPEATTKLKQDSQIKESKPAKEQIKNKGLVKKEPTPKAAENQEEKQEHVENAKMEDQPKENINITEQAGKPTQNEGMVKNLTGEKTPEKPGGEPATEVNTDVTIVPGQKPNLPAQTIPTKNKNVIVKVPAVKVPGKSKATTTPIVTPDVPVVQEVKKPGIVIAPGKTQDEVDNVMDPNTEPAEMNKKTAALPAITYTVVIPPFESGGRHNLAIGLDSNNNPFLAEDTIAMDFFTKPYDNLVPPEVIEAFKNEVVYPVPILVPNEPSTPQPATEPAKKEPVMTPKTPAQKKVKKR